jgi:transketolase
MRQTALDMVWELARKDPRVVFVGSDLTQGMLSDMKKEMPERFFMEGVSEQAIIGMAAGLAREGFIPYVNNIATFLTRRCYEQVALDICLHKLPIRLIANGAGLTYAPLGPTHLAVEDIAIMRALPGMTIVAPCDAPEMRRFMTQTLDWPQPIYIRLAKGFDPVVSSDAVPFQIGKAISMRPGDGRVLLITTGVMTTRALKAADVLAESGLQAEVLHMHTVKPLDRSALIERGLGARLIVTIEEHTVIGGLGSAVSDALAEADLLRHQLRLGLPDAFCHDYESQDHLLNSVGLSPAKIAERVLTKASGLDVV